MASMMPDLWLPSVTEHTCMANITD